MGVDLAPRYGCGIGRVPDVRGGLNPGGQEGTKCPLEAGETREGMPCLLGARVVSPAPVPGNLPPPA
jgi:hypothetical protein